jgi:tetratricopeptide (TPR) repeat protein
MQANPWQGSGVRLVHHVEPDPAFAAELGHQAALHASRDEHPQALACYQRALLLDDSRADLWFNYANLQRRAGMTEDAVESFEFAVRLDPRLYAARYCLANLLADLGRPLAAITQYQQAILQNPDYVPAWRNLGRLHHALGNLGPAHECLAEAIRRAPHDAELVDLLAQVLRQREAAAEN